MKQVEEQLDGLLAPPLEIYKINTDEAIFCDRNSDHQRQKKKGTPLASLNIISLDGGARGLKDKLESEINPKKN